jgi:hypothetical protein
MALTIHVGSIHLHFGETKADAIDNNVVDSIISSISSIDGVNSPPKDQLPIVSTPQPIPINQPQQSVANQIKVLQAQILMLQSQR